MPKIQQKTNPCVEAAKAVVGDALSDADVHAAVKRVADLRDNIRNAGDVDNLEQRVKRRVTSEAERTRIAAALQRKHAGLNILVRDKLNTAIADLRAQGLSPRKALLALMEGTPQGVRGGRVSAGAMQLGYEARYIGDMFAEIAQDRPHIVGLLRDKKFDEDIMREMHELREGGKPGTTGNEDAKAVAAAFAKYAELARQDLNGLGAAIGKLDGWAGPQSHDDIKLMQHGKQQWIADITPLLDMDRTFGDGLKNSEIVELLDDVYDTLVTGTGTAVTAVEKGQRVNPANLAKMLGKSRVLHFKDPDTALTYREKYGFGNTVSGMISHLRLSARNAGVMHTFGPNPEVMMNAIAAKMKREIAHDKTIDSKTKLKQTKGLDDQFGTMSASLRELTGLNSRPVNVTGAKIAADVRAVQSMAKLGGATITAIPSDTVTAAAASMFRGGGFFNGMVEQVNGMMAGRPKGEQQQIAFLIGEGFDGLIGHIVSPAAATDSPVGRLARLQETFFKWNGLTWWTDVQRATSGRVISAEMGMRSTEAFDALPDRYKHVLGLHGINEDIWKLIQKVPKRDVGGKSYITPDRIREIDAEEFKGLVAERLSAAEAKLKGPALQKKRAEILEGARRDTEMQLRAFFADEVGYATVETDVASRRIANWGQRPGTLAGELARFVMQFKGFPVAFTQRVLGRALFGGAGATRGQRFMNNVGHMGALLAGMTMAGYMTNVMKDFGKGYWPPRDPTNYKTILSAMQTGGGLGIYGDFLFGEASRYGNTPLETAAGPTIGGVSDLIVAGLQLRDGDPKGGEWLNIALSSTPFINLAYTRPVLDYLFLNSLREASSPGFLRRREERRRKEYGQQSFLPQRL